jgi:hypothetical protein
VGLFIAVDKAMITEAMAQRKVRNSTWYCMTAWINPPRLIWGDENVHLRTFYYVPEQKQVSVLGAAVDQAAPPAKTFLA